jgi:D-alanyl-D-alanine carboxypeptidase/D-alanyl-D-alanine-endopeptidase (penicillin-binding protein 4)
VTALASQLVRAAGIHRISGSVMGDETYLDSRRGEPSSGYAPDPFLEGTLSGLSFDRGVSGSERGRHAPAAYAARRLWAALKGYGVTIRGKSGAAPTPPGATLLARVQSPTVAQLMGLMLPPSDNFFAETLLKDLGARFAGAGTTAAGAAVIAQTIAALLGIHPRVVDGSGLSPADQTSPQEVGELLVQIAQTPIGSVLRESLAVAGRSGTLKRRMRHTGAAGRCMGKTGTLTGVSNLVGYCQSAGGHLLAFAIFTDGIPTLTAHTFQDHIVITLANSKIEANGEAARAGAAQSALPLVSR